MNKTIKKIRQKSAKVSNGVFGMVSIKSESLKIFFKKNGATTLPLINQGIKQNFLKLKPNRSQAPRPEINFDYGQDDEKKKSFSGLFSTMSTQEQIIFTKRLAILIKAGVSIMSALNMLQQQSSSTGAKKIIGHLRDCVEVGQPLAKAMANYGKVFGKFAVSIVQIGEMSGTLTQNLNYLADELKKKQELKRNIVSALIYPVFILVATVGIVVLLTVYVFPKILPVFQSFRTALPWTTRTLIAISWTMQHYWLYIFGGFILASVLISLSLKNPMIKLASDRANLRVPLVGSMFKSYYIANFSRTLGLLLKSEVGIIQALRLAGDTSGSAAYRVALNKLIDGVARGEAIAANMEKDKFLFPPLVSQMVGVGEMTGNLSSSLMYLAEIYEDEMNNSTKNLSTSIEPALMIFMGVLVGFIAISIITPIYGITQSLHP
jgi:type II secretory pathway component PulF